MIPKTIHYCWFGGSPKPKKVLECIKSWHVFCPDYQVIEWNEDNINISRCPKYVSDAYRNRKWAFVTDYIRLKVVFENGGIYLDTDVELVKNTDSLLEYNAFFGFENGTNINTGQGFGAVCGSRIIKEMMDAYDSMEFVLPDGTLNLQPCPVINTEVLEKHGLIKDNSLQLLEDAVVVLPSDYMSPLDNSTGRIKISKNTISIHWFNASWYTEEQHIYHDYQIRKKRLQNIFGYKVGEYLIKIVYRLFYREERKKLMKM